ncbi:MAG: two-component system, OmpR family, sensor kinase [Gaiellales bacterium]|jgi:two-component system OmpR family sensor kinase|nr:two-component system, OmpR family, sensor kinase [Gaiellales bacterium]
MRPQSLRLRVALAAGAAIALATILLGVTVVALSEREAASSRDAALRAGASQVAQLSASAPALLTAPGALEGRVGSRRLLVEVLDRHGRIVARSASLGGGLLGTRAEIAAIIASGRARFSNASRGDESLRVYGAPLADLGSGIGAGGAVLIATGTGSDQASAHRVRVLVLIAAACAALLAIGIALLLTRRALRPLTDLSAAARAIGETGDATRRLPPAGSGDEVGALSQTLNAMLASLERAREAERRFVADASHELRTPLTALRGNAAYIAQHGANADVLTDLENDAQRLARLLDDLLALAREDAAGPLSVELVRLDVLARALASPRVAVVAPAPVTVRGDADALTRALGNLVENALVHGPANESVTVEVQELAGRAHVSVTDRGRGLSPDQAEHAFERFWRAPATDAPPGSGLGLAIVRATAERHGGRVSVAGATFTLDLPAAG